MLKRKYAACDKPMDLKIKKARKLINWAKNFQKGGGKIWFVPKSIDEDGFLFSYGPRNEILFVLDENENNIMPLKKLEVLFEQGFTGDADEAISDYLPFFDNKQGCKGLISAHDDKKGVESNFGAMGFNFIYVIDASKGSDLNCIPYSLRNTMNPKFFEESLFDAGAMDWPGAFFIVPSSCKPSCIVGAFAEKYLAHSFNINEETLIVNPYYTGDLNTIKSKLNISRLQTLKDCRLHNFTFDSAEAAYMSGPGSLKNRYQRVIKILSDKIKNNGFEAPSLDTQLLLDIEKTVDTTPFFPEQIEKIKQIVNYSKEANQLISEEKCRAIQFEAGSKESECLISLLPAEMRERIYQELFPLKELHKKNSIPYFITKKHREKFVKEIITYSNSVEDKLIKKDSYFLAGESIDFDKPSTSGLTSNLKKMASPPYEELEESVKISNDTQRINRFSDLFSFPIKDSSSSESEIEQEEINRLSSLFSLPIKEGSSSESETEKESKKIAFYSI